MEGARFINVSHFHFVQESRSQQMEFTLEIHNKF
jgi:hypothetical protein